MDRQLGQALLRRPPSHGHDFEQAVRCGGGFRPWRAGNRPAGPRCWDSAAGWPAWSARAGRRAAGRGRWSSSAAAGLRWSAAAGSWVEELVVVARQEAGGGTARPARPACWARRRWAALAPCFSCSICTRNSMSTMPPGPRFRSPGAGRFFQPLPHLADRLGVLRRASDGRRPPWPRPPSRALATARRAVDHPRLAQRLPLPKLPVALGEVAGELVERRGQRAALAGGPQPGVDLVQPAVAGSSWLAVLMIRWPSSLKKCWLVVRARAAAAGVGHGLAVGLVEEDDVQVAVVVHLAAAELAQRQDDHLAGLAGARPLADRRLAELGRQPLVLRVRRSAPGRLRRCRTARRSWPGCLPCPECRARPRKAAGRS